MRAAAATARTSAADFAVLSMLIDGIGPWLVAEYVPLSVREAVSLAGSPS